MRSVTAGWVAGTVSVLPALAAAALAPQQNLRQSGTPWVLAAWAVLLLLCVRGVHALHVWTERRSCARGAEVHLERVGYGCLAASLCLVAVFFAALGLEDVLSAAGLPRVLSDNEAVTGIGTLAASVSSLVLLPVGLLLFGIATLWRKALPWWGRAMPLCFAALLALTAIAAASSDSAVAATMCLVLAAIGSFLLGLALWRARPAPLSAESRRADASTAGCERGAAGLV